MSTVLNNCACPTPVVTDIPGTEGAAGTPGINAYSILTEALEFTAPGQTVFVGVLSKSWMAVGQIVLVSDGINFVTCEVAGFGSGQLVQLTFLDYPGDASIFTVFAIGSSVSVSGRQGATGNDGTSPASISGVNPFTDNTTGGASDVLSAGVGIKTLAFYCVQAQITATTIMSFTPGYAFKVLGIQWSQEIAVTTAAKAATITPAVNGVSVTGGALALTSAACTPKGTTISGSAITAANVGTNTQTLSLVASSVTAFSEGTGWIILKIQNMDDANAAASIAAKINNILTYLTSF